MEDGNLNPSFYLMFGLVSSMLSKFVGLIGLPLLKELQFILSMDESRMTLVLCGRVGWLLDSINRASVVFGAK